MRDIKHNIHESGTAHLALPVCCRNINKRASKLQLVNYLYCNKAVSFLISPPSEKRVPWITWGCSVVPRWHVSFSLHERTQKRRIINTFLKIICKSTEKSGGPSQQCCQYLEHFSDMMIFYFWKYLIQMFFSWKDSFSCLPPRLPPTAGANISVAISLLPAVSYYRFPSPLSWSWWSRLHPARRQMSARFCCLRRGTQCCSGCRQVTLWASSSCYGRAQASRRCPVSASPRGCLTWAPDLLLYSVGRTHCSAARPGGRREWPQLWTHMRGGT